MTDSGCLCPRIGLEKRTVIGWGRKLANRPYFDDVMLFGNLVQEEKWSIIYPAVVVSSHTDACGTVGIRLDGA